MAKREDHKTEGSPDRYRDLNVYGNIENDKVNSPCLQIPLSPCPFSSPVPSSVPRPSSSVPYFNKKQQK